MLNESYSPVSTDVDREPPYLGGMEITCHISIVPTRPFLFSSTFLKKYTMLSPQSCLLCSSNPLPYILSSGKCISIDLLDNTAVISEHLTLNQTGRHIGCWQTWVEACETKPQSVINKGELSSKLLECNS